MSAINLKGKRALVTGAADGIGRAITDLFTSEGAKVVAVDLVGEKLNAAHAGNDSVHTIILDITNDDAADQLVKAVKEHLGGLDIIVNNAGIVGEFAPLSDTKDETYRRVMAVNVDAPFRLTRAVVPMLKESAAGRIINVTSCVSEYAIATAGSYAASKHALTGLTKAFAMELGEFGITANCIRPGSTLTGLTRDALPDPNSEQGRRLLKATTAIRRYAEPSDMAGAALYLASDIASYVTGTSILVDGGLTGTTRDAAFWSE